MNPVIAKIPAAKIDIMATFVPTSAFLLDVSVENHLFRIDFNTLNPIMTPPPTPIGMKEDNPNELKILDTPNPAITEIIPASIIYPLNWSNQVFFFSFKVFISISCFQQYVQQ